MKKRIVRFINRILITIRRPEMAILPGQLAFFSVLSLVPIISLVGITASFFPVSVEKIMAFSTVSFSPVLNDTMEKILSTDSFDFNIILFLLATFVIASNGMASIIRVSNILYDSKVQDPLKLKIKAVMLTILVVLLMVFILLVPVFGGYILDFIRKMNLSSSIIDSIYEAYHIIKWPLSFLYIFFNIKLIYTIAPDITIQSKDVTYGAIFTSFMWIGATYIYAYYVTHFAKYDLFYGALSSVISLMFWVYILCYVFVLGMALNASKPELDKTLVNIFKEE